MPLLVPENDIHGQSPARMDAGGEQWQLELGNSNSSKDDIVIMHIIALHCLLFMFTHYLSNKPSCMYLVSCINLCLKISR